MRKEQIKQIVDTVFNTDVSKRSRKTNEIVPRFIYFTLARRYTDQSLDSVAELTNTKQHGTVKNGIIKLDGLLEAYPHFKPYYIECESLILKKCNEQNTPYYYKLKKKFENKVRGEAEVEPKKSKDSIDKSIIILDITNELLKLSNDNLLNFKEYRLKPYLGMLKSEVIREFTGVRGAARNHIMKI
mgnify:FL=1